MAAILGKKLGMTQVFREDGTVVPVTVIEAGPCKVTAVREEKRDGYAAVQLGTRFIATPEASVHDNYKRAVLAADVGDTTLVGRGGLPIRQLKNAFSSQYEAAERSGKGKEELEKIFKSSPLKQAALEGDVERGKVEAGQSAGLVDDILPAAEVMRRLVAEAEIARKRLSEL